MLEQVMRERSCSLKVKLTVKGLVSFGLIVLAVLLPGWASAYCRPL